MTPEPRVVYQVTDFERARDFFKRLLGFEETGVDFDQHWSTLSHGEMHIAIAEGDPDPEVGVAMVDVGDIRAETARLRGEGIEVGTIVEVAGQMLLVDIFDPDGNRVQLSQQL